MTDGSGHDELVGVPAPDQVITASYIASLDTPHRKLRRLEILTETAGRLLAGQNPDVDVLPWLASVLAADLGVDTCLSYVAGPDGALSLAFCQGMDADLALKSAPLPPSQTANGTVAIPRQAGLRAYVTEPLVSADRVLGTLSFGSRTRDHFEADYLAFFRRLAGHFALARQQADAAWQLAERELHARQRLAEVETANAELHHRVKNLLTTVQAIASSTVRSAASLPEFEDAFGGRLKALAKTHDLLVTGAKGATSLVRLLRSELDPYDDEAGRRVQLYGPDVVLGSEIAVPLGMAVHELTTNAAKHGALSVGTGSVHVEWSLSPSESGEQLELRWIEEGGPVVSPPSRRGFGSQLLERVLGGQFGTKVEREFAPQGLRVRIDLQL